jgi:hypothetical protein
VDELAEGAGALGVSAGDIAKLATKLTAQELRSAVTKEAPRPGHDALTRVEVRPDRCPNSDSPRPRYRYREWAGSYPAAGGFWGQLLP